MQVAANPPEPPSRELAGAAVKAAEEADEAAEKKVAEETAANVAAVEVG